MSSEHLASAQNQLKGDLAGSWNILDGASGQYTDLGIARKFGGAAAAYSLRDIGAMNGRVVKVRRDVDGQGTDPEVDFSASQAQSGALEDWINGKQESTLPCNVGTDFASGSFVVSNSNSASVNGTYTFNPSNSRWEKSSIIYFHLDSSTWTLVVGASNIAATTNGEYPWTSIYSLSEGNISFGIEFSSIDFSTAAAAYSLRKVKASYGGDAVRIRRSSDDIEVNVAFDSDDKVSASSAITNVAEEGGESGQTTDTTLGDFISGTDAFVHTWYDQAGSNDAVQATAANQPKIAENGALLTDENGLPEIKFTPDASNGKFLSFTTINFSDTMGMFFKAIIQNTGGSSRTLSKDGSFTHIVQFLNSTSIVINTTTDATFTVPDFTTRSKLHTLLTASDSANYFGNAATADSPQAVDMNSNFQLNQIGTGANTSGATRADFDTSELIFYTSDQTDNRFKIESNINNYYGLYNDGRDVTGDFVNSGNGTFLSSSITDDELNFDYDPADTSEFFGIQLAEKVVDGDEIFISFNQTGGFNPLVLLRHTSPTGGNISGTQSNLNGDGFQAFKLTCNSTNANDSFLVFQTRLNPSGSYNVTNLKVSRIARDGKVQTWYDQSGSGQNATQSSANFQPFIIRYGGQIKLPNSRTPSIGLLRSGSLNSILSISSKITTEPYTFFGTGFAYNNRSTAFFSEAATYQRPALLAGSTSGTGSVRYRPDNLTDTGSITSGINVHTDFYITAYSGENGGDDYILRLNGSQIATGARAEAGDGIQVIGSFDAGTTNITCIESWVLYTSDLTSDAADIENQLAQPIGLI